MGWCIGGGTRSDNLGDEAVKLFAVIDVLDGAKPPLNLLPFTADRLRHVGRVMQQSLMKQQCKCNRQAAAPAHVLGQQLNLVEGAAPSLGKQKFDVPTELVPNNANAIVARGLTLSLQFFKNGDGLNNVLGRHA